MKSISTLINQDVRKLIEKVCNEFPEVPLTKMLLIIQEIYGSKEEEETNTSLMQGILNLINQENWKLVERVHEEVPQLQIHEMLSIWCELQQICGFEFPDKQEPSAAPEELLRKTDHYTCEHVYIKGKNANTQCKVKVKGDGFYCSKHKPKSG
jgi:hypothetical protein